MNILSHNKISGRLFRTITALLLICIQTTPVQADVAINIKGDIYGGGKQGHVGTENTNNALAQKENVQISDANKIKTDTTTVIVINQGSVRTVFGGGENGRTFGSTSITVNGGTVGDSTWIGTIHGGLFAAGDGEEAYVFGHSHVDIKGGTIVQNVYGGGNKADLMGTTNVTLLGGDIQGDVYGGARVANVYGYSLVNIDGANATDDLIIGSVYGGNDIAGNITIPDFENSWEWIDINNLNLPSILSSDATGSYGINKTWNAFVHSSDIPQENTNKIYVAQVFGGGNGDYSYNDTLDNKYVVKDLKDTVWNKTAARCDTVPYEFIVANQPEVSKAYLELKGGNFGYVYGGGNKATVTEETVICLNNDTEDLYTFESDKLRSLGINLDVDTAAYDFSNERASAKPRYQFDRVFGGNKLADMAIHPKWHLENATINALYSGGDAGNMTYPEGLMLALTNSKLSVKNVYGGCRRADVTPKQNGTPVTPGARTYTDGGKSYTYPKGYSSHILVTAGNIGNVYGGNDISGNVAGGNAIIIRSDIKGNVYGGGNGSYVYTDNKDYDGDPTYGDFYYGDFSPSDNVASVDSLNKFRPHAAKSYINVAGTAENGVAKVTHIPAVYGGGNSATVTDTIRLVLGQYTNIDNVFLGSNGIDMVNQEPGGTLDLYSQISNLNLKDSTIFDTYMQGAAVRCKPIYEFDGSYPRDYEGNEDKLAYIGSFFCGGNVGSMTSAQSFNISFLRPIIITNKLVGGCNNAFVKESSYNARNEGGFTTPSSSEKIHLTVNGVIFANSVDTTAGNQGNIFGGCFNSGIINGDVVIDIKQSIIPSSSPLSTSMDNYLANADNLFNTPFSVFGGGFGPEATIKGNTAINITSDIVGTGRALKVFGGGYGGAVEGNTAVTLSGGEVGKLYGGGFEGVIDGNTAVYLTGGTAYDTFGGSCNADITGYAQTFAGTGLNNTTGSSTIKNNIFGGNDFGGRITGTNDFIGKVSDDSKVYKPQGASEPTVTIASAYVEYVAGNIGNYIFGGSCGNYNYNNPVYQDHKHRPDSIPYLANAFVNFKPNSSSSTTVKKVFGAGQGFDGGSKSDSHQDRMQDRSYVYVDVPEGTAKFSTTEIFGAGAYSGVGMGVDPGSEGFNKENVSAVVDLVRGQIMNAYGGGYEQGVTRRTVVNVPEGSTVKAEAIFGGAYGIRNSAPCDVYESQVNYRSGDTDIKAVYGGNNNKRRTLYTQVNIYSPVLYTTEKQERYNAPIFGAGKGEGTWVQYTEVNLLNGAVAYNVYGGGDAGRVLNIESVKAWKTYTPDASENANTTTAAVYRDLGSEWYNDSIPDNDLVHSHTIDGQVVTTNTNVNIYPGGQGGYIYGGGLGETASVSGSTFVGLLGGTATRDIYGSGSNGSVINKDKLDYTAQTWVYAESGTARNIYGGGWRGSVGYHDESTADTINDVLGYSNVIVGKIDGTDFQNGKPAILRNVYGGGEGGTIYGTANVTINNGYVGFRYTDGQYVEELVDWENSLDKSGNVFGGGYVINSFVDRTNVKVYGGTIRGNLYGGGEVGPIGRGNVNNIQPTGTLTPFINGPVTIYKAGHTHVEMYGGHVMRNIFGGGRGIDSWGGDGRKFMDQMMTTQEINDCDWASKGYVFGQTEVFVRGGEVGTPANVALGYGNVFGGGDLGFVYSGSSKKGAAGEPGFNSTYSTVGYYYEYDGSEFKVDAATGENILTDDSRVIIEPYAIVTRDGVEIADSTFAVGQYIPTDYLDKLKNKNADSVRWSKISDNGITIRNAVFAGGNVSSGSDVVYANTNTVLGNATATLRDVYNRDLITIGTEHTGGLYGDGNLTLVDGYRELNITNYGTDYFSQPQEITLAVYHDMTDREKAYYELKYKCKTQYTDKNGKLHSLNEQLSAQDYNDLINSTAITDTTYWQESGFVSIYAGRLLNTIQRADFCGVFGSRMVLQGAHDRVPEIVDYTNYTVNRIGELSLNQVHSLAGDQDSINEVHGNYFGIYSIVNHLGALTSDVDFYNAERQWDNQDKGTYKPDSVGQTYYDWKEKYADKRKRNNGTSANKVALASGVYLEITTEESTKDSTVWGPITGVVELDLINVMVGLGGGYVYAKNIHGVQSATNLEQTILSQYNLAKTDGGVQAHAKAVTHKAFKYDETDADLTELQTSGNFIHPQKQIVDDCYPAMGSYHLGGSPAHYWFIKGSIYVYDQYISAYTGSANAYSESVNIPLTITAQSHGKIQLLEVQPSLYAFYSESPNEQTERRRNLRDDDTTGVLINNLTYKLNDSISYWDWCLLSDPDRSKFVKETYVSIAACSIGNKFYNKGYVLLPEEYTALKCDSVYAEDRESKMAFEYVFRPSNNLGHNTGYILTYDMNNPVVWDKYHTPKTGSSHDYKLTLEQYDTLKTGRDDYYEGPTYYTTKPGVYGQRYYNVDDIVPGSIHDVYEAMGNNKPQENQATVERAFVATTEVVSGNMHLYTGAGTYKSQFGSDWDNIKDKVDSAYICTSTLDLGNDQYIYYGELIPASVYDTLKAKYEGYFDVAWYCTAQGNYGGAYYETGKNYLGIDTWSSMSEADREYFKFNYDALDLLIDPQYRNILGYYDSTAVPVYDKLYSKIQPIDYVAIYEGVEGSNRQLSYKPKTGDSVYISVGDTLQREEYEIIPNEQYHYAPIKVEAHSGDTVIYIVNTTSTNGGTILSAGKTVTEKVYNSISNKTIFDAITFAASDQEITLYYCRESYKVGQNGEGKPVTAIKGAYNGQTRDIDANVEKGFIINSDNYESLTNKQKNFTVLGTAPVGTSTLVVSRESDIFNLSKGKVITVVYQYDYEESDESGTHIEPITEKHIVNIHIDFKSGIPFIDELTKPNIVLPGSTVGLKIPNVTPGAYEILGSGWEMFTNEDDASQHKNGIPYTNNMTPMYWYEDGYMVAYYTKTYLGKTYSNAVPFSVANYHRMNDVMLSKHKETYIDREDQNQEVHDTIIYDYMYLDEAVRDYSRLKRNPKVYIKNLNEFNQFNRFFDVIKGADEDSRLYHIANANHIDFILDGDINFKADSTWTSVGNGTYCFEGNMHGDGHTISGLNNSLFGKLCGDVYNLGVTGSFTGSGIADEGSGNAINCWVLTTGDVAATTAPILGDDGNVENSYYYNNYKSDVHADAHQMEMKSFMDGEVTYNLNKYYLTRRYYNDHSASGTDAVRSIAWTDNTTTVLDTTYYAAGTEDYVEERYRYSDFIYVVGYVPESMDIRDNGNNEFSPIYPDDYIYFGQNLTYDIITGGGDHDVHPNAIASGTRVYRTPAYYQNKNKSSVYFNRHAALKDSYVYNGNSVDIHKSMTAIDFTEYNDTEWNAGYDSNGLFYTPITDFDGLSSYVTQGLTQNMLAYFTTEKDQNSVLRSYYHKDGEMEFDFADNYGSVRAVEERAYSEIKGHLVELTSNVYEAVFDHFLVDKQDFNAPISYTVPYGQHMWYQRVPGTYVNSMDSGWETVSLPFTAEYVTTHQKGEITHFYQGDKIGHEYWLREYDKVDDNDASKLLFKAPANNGTDRTVDNTFLWDYYYSKNNQLDKNADEYQVYYNNHDRSYSKYPRYTAGVPYLIGFPGKRFYEFDLSGDWIVSNTATDPDGVPEQLHKQYITFASSGKGTVINVTDDEYLQDRTQIGGYTFMPTYQAQTLIDSTTYLLNKAGDTFKNDNTNDSIVTTVPFRAYITSANVGSNGAPRRISTRANALYIGYAGDNDQLIEVPVDRGLNIYGDNMNIIIESTLTEPAAVTIVTTAGRLLKQLTVQPGTKVTVPVNSRGIYIVNRHKVAITK